MSILPPGDPVAPDVCPACGSGRVLVGAFPLSCQACGWHHLNRHPCRVCGGPSRAAMGGGGPTLYACPAHPFTAEEVRACFRTVIDAIRGTTAW